MSLKLGPPKPANLTVDVTPGQDWWANGAGPCPDGAQLQLRFAGGPTWTATFAGELVSFSQSADDVAALTNGQLVELWYLEAGKRPQLANRGSVVFQ